MSTEWPTVAIEDVCELIVDCVNKTAPVVDRVTPYRMIRTTNVRNGRIDLTECRHVEEATYKTWTRRAQLQIGDVILTREAPIGEVGFVTEAEGVFLGQRLMQYRANPKVLDSRYLLYCFLSPALQHQFGSHEGSGSVVSHIRVGDCFKFKLQLPPLHIQRAIAQTLGALDDRITLLRETNTTLEAIAQALFKSWFVDFDPVHAKIQGRAPEGMDEATAALFPESLEESELGPVPNGWSVGAVGDFARLKKGAVNPGSQPDTVFEHFSLPAFDDGQSPVIESGASIKSNKTPVPEDAVLLSKLNPHIPRIWLPVSTGRNAVCSTEFLAFQPTGVGSRELIYCLFSSPEFISRLQQLVTGTSNSHQRIKPDQVALMTSVVPTASIASAFEILMRPVFEQVHKNRQKVQTLSAIRDVLVPRLISGQLRLNEALESLQ
jgi:type I restriction enzyme S subunit